MSPALTPPAPPAGAPTSWRSGRSGEQLVVAAVLDDAAVLEHQDRSASTTVDRRCAMISVVRPAERRRSAALDQALGAGVERRGRLVEDQDRRVLQDHARDRDPLLLAARELQARARRPWCRSRPAGRDEVVDLRRARRGLDLGLGGAGAAVGDVRPDGVVEQDGVLRHQADRGAQGLLSDVAQVLAVDQDRALAHVVEAEQEAHHVDLPAPELPTSASVWPAGTVKSRSCRIGRLRIVAEAHVRSGPRRRSAPAARARPVLDLGLELEQGHQVLEVD